MRTHLTDCYSACTVGGNVAPVLAVRAFFMLMLLASIICVDRIIRKLPGKKNFKIENSNPFLSSGLSLSFGVMVRLFIFFFCCCYAYVT